MKYYLFLLLTVMLSSVTTGQSDIKYCEFEIDALYKENIKEAFLTLTDNSNIGLTSIPLALTFLMKTDSTSLYYEGLEEQIMDSITAHFMPAGIHFYLADSPVFIYEDLVYDFTVGDNVELIYPGLKNNRLDIVIANSVSFDNGVGVCGFANVYPFTVFINYNCISSNTISHEIGHELGLTHTHQTYWGVEFVDGSNCKTTGDLLCDTPADPNRPDLVSSDCEWVGIYEDENGFDINLVDTKGDVYETDVSNLMSYYGVNGCRNDFSHEQSVVMNHKIAQKISSYGYETPKMLFDVYDIVDLCEDGYSVSAGVKDADLNVDYKWDFDADGEIDALGIDASHLYLEYGQYTIKLIMTYPDGRQFYQSKLCIVEYSNESIVAPFLDDFEEEIERKYVNLIEETAYKWNLGLHLAANGRVVAGDQIHINERSVMEYKVDISDLENAVLEFEYECNANANVGGDSLLIELITCDSEPIVIFEKWGKNLGTNGAFVTIKIPLPLGVLNVVKIRFTTIGDAQDYHDIYIDNLQVYENDQSNTEESINNELSVFPNPTWSSVKIKTELNISKIILINLNGYTISTYYENSEIDLSNLPAGIYFVKIFTGEKWISKKILKLN